MVQLVIGATGISAFGKTKTLSSSLVDMTHALVTFGPDIDWSEYTKLTCTNCNHVCVTKWSSEWFALGALNIETRAQAGTLYAGVSELCMIGRYLGHYYYNFIEKGCASMELMLQDMNTQKTFLCIGLSPSAFQTNLGRKRNRDTTIHRALLQCFMVPLSASALHLELLFSLLPRPPSPPLLSLLSPWSKPWPFGALFFQLLLDTDPEAWFAWATFADQAFLSDRALEIPHTVISWLPSAMLARWHAFDGLWPAWLPCLANLPVLSAHRRMTRAPAMWRFLHSARQSRRALGEHRKPENKGRPRKHCWLQCRTWHFFYEAVFCLDPWDIHMPCSARRTLVATGVGENQWFAFLLGQGDRLPTQVSHPLCPGCVRDIGKGQRDCVHDRMQLNPCAPSENILQELNVP